jgi:hypothetical protein
MAAMVTENGTPTVAEVGSYTTYLKRGPGDTTMAWVLKVSELKPAADAEILIVSARVYDSEQRAVEPAEVLAVTEFKIPVPGAPVPKSADKATVAEPAATVFPY